MFKRSVRLLLRTLGVAAGRLPSGFPGTALYWEHRYKGEGTSGLGSYGFQARVKARFVNAYVQEYRVRSVIDFGAGDGNQLRLFRMPRYVGLDVSPTAIQRLRQQFASDATKRFVWSNGDALQNDPSLRADLGLSLDVIYHLIEDDVYHRYLQDLFTCAQQHVIIYSSNSERRKLISRHVRHRRFTADVAVRFPEWRLEEVRRTPLGTLATSRFFVYRKQAGMPRYAESRADIAALGCQR